MSLKVTKPGWKGKLHVAQAGRTLDGGDGFVVAFDVRAPDGWFVYDTKVLTVEQIRMWTGVTVKERP